MAFERIKPDVPVTELPPLKDVKCGDTQCDNGLHNFRPRPKANFTGDCTECGADPIEWEEVRNINTENLDFKFDRMQTEYIRYAYWNLDIDDTVIEKASRFTHGQLKERAKRRVISSLNKPWHDGGQTPLAGKSQDILHYAQHATSTCCRKCLHYWHDIPKKGELTDDQINYCVDLIMSFVDKRVNNK